MITSESHLRAMCAVMDIVLRDAEVEREKELEAWPCDRCGREITDEETYWINSRYLGESGFCYACHEDYQDERRDPEHPDRYL